MGQLHFGDALPQLWDGEITLDLLRRAKGDPARGWVDAYHFAICLEDGTVAGLCDLRLGYNENTYYGGNIGYSVKPEHRGHHYAAKACRILFDLARLHGMEYLIITCNPDNIASYKTCEAVGGRLLEIAKLPPDNDMALAGEPEKRIYRVELT